MIKVGITGQSGFIGSHLFSYLGLKDDIVRVPFEDNYFSRPGKLNDFVKRCDVIIHLAAVNRHPDEDELYRLNIELAELLLKSCEDTFSKPHIIFSSSTQEKYDNSYGRSKLDGRKLFEDWAKRNNSKFTGMIIPNVFGPFCKPYYNSVVATFCHQLTHNETPEIKVDKNLDLIYVNDLSMEFYRHIAGVRSENILIYSPTVYFTCTVSSLLSILNNFRDQYLGKSVFPELSDPFKLALFNTFRCYVPKDHYPVPLEEHSDERGSFCEVVRSFSSGQFSISTTRPGITRGNHFHLRKAERFAVTHGKAIIRLRRIGTPEVTEYFLSGETPSFVDIPVWHTHNISNAGDDLLSTLFWVNEHYDPDDPDTFFEQVDDQH